MELSLEDWLREFRLCHELAKRGELSEIALRDYWEARNELARALLNAQNQRVQPRHEPRHCLRVFRVLQVNIALFEGPVRTATRTISSQGFETILASPPIQGAISRVSLRIPGREPLHASARVTQWKRQLGHACAWFGFVDLPQCESERLETFVFDAVLEQFSY